MGPTIKKYVKPLQFAFVLLSIGFLFVLLLRTGQEFWFLLASAKPFNLLSAIIFWQGTIFLSGFFSFLVLSPYDGRARYREVLAIYLKRIPAKYLPGGVWQTVARAVDMSSIGVGKKDLTRLVFYENFWSVFIALLLCGILMGGLADELLFVRLGGFLLLLCLAGLAAVFALKPLQWLRLSLKAYLRLSLVCVVFWSFACLAFCFYLGAFDLIHEDDSFLLISAYYMLSYVIGFISVFAPQGIGVFEGAMAGLGDFSLSFSEAVIVIAGFRLVTIGSDMINWLIYCGLKKTGIFP